MKKTFLVIYEKGRKSFSGFAPDVAGCGSAGDTLDETRDNLRSALELYMQVSVERGLSLPEPAAETVTLPLEGEIDPKTTYVVEHLTINVPGSKSARPRSTKSLAKMKTNKRRSLQAA
jgi:predicted RNase H-like HicB family nuclease